MATDNKSIENVEKIPENLQTIPNYIKFIFGGSAGMAASCVVQPIDLIKTRMQVAQSRVTIIGTFQETINKNGFFGLYDGLSAALLRQATYTTTRLGIYNTLMEKYNRRFNEQPNFGIKSLIAMTAGATGAFVGTPAEVALIRMTSDGKLPINERRNYKNVFDALIRIIREERVFTLWKGAGATVGRAMIINAAQLATYSQAKDMLLASPYFTDGIPCHFAASMISGFVTSLTSLPVDISKTRIQNMKIIDGKPEYSGAFDVIKKVIKHEGTLQLWKGFIPYYMRIGPHTVLTFIFLEQFNVAYKRFAYK